MNKNILIAVAVVVLGAGTWWMMSGDTPQGLIDETTAMVEECAKTSDIDVQKECDERSKNLNARWNVLIEDMTKAEKKEWEKKSNLAKEAVMKKILL